MKKCPYCAEEIQEEATVCKHCGRDLQEQNPARKGWTAIAGLSLGLTVMGLFCSMVNPRPEIGSLFSWAIILGAIGLMIGIVGRGFAR